MIIQNLLLIIIYHYLLIYFNYLVLNDFIIFNLNYLIY